MNKKNLLPRIIVSPIILLLLLVTYLINTIKVFCLFIRWGGEWITLQEGDAKRIIDIYELLKSKGHEKETNS